MESPVPRLRSNSKETKKPIPTPRRNINPNLKKISEDAPTQIEENTNTLTKRVSSASKQLAEDISQLVHGRKKAVIEGTRQSVRRITRRFSSASQEQNNPDETDTKNEEDTINIFNSITFNSPFARTENIYNNVDDSSSESSEGSIELPPPSHPPPPLPDESIYDAPLSLASSSTSGHSAKTTSRPDVYESIFPLFPNKSDSTSGSNSTEQTECLSRSGSWKFYDPVPSKENQNANIYNNIEEEIAQTDGNVSDIKTDVDLNSNVSVISSMVRKNSLYENHEVIPQRPPRRPPRPSESVILQFDPLNKEETSAPYTFNSDLKLLEELLQGDLYGNISNAHTFDEWSISNESESEDVLSPPTPPMRSDSLPEEDPEPEKSTPKSRSNWFTEDTVVKEAPVENKKLSWFKHVKEAIEKAPDVVRGVKNKDNILERPAIGLNKCVQKKGMLYKVQNGPVEDLFGEYSGRWCVLENSSLMCYSDNSCQNLKENFPSQNILSIQILQDKKYNYRYDNDDLYCFELNTTGKSRGGHVYGTRNISERRVWAQLIAESLTNRFSSKVTTNFSRMGWAYVREGVSGKWVGAWIILTHREFRYAIDGQSVKKKDLRKARCILLQPYVENDNNPRTNDRGPNMLIDCPDLVLYLRMWTSRETKVWCHIVKLEAHNNGANLDQQQLTKNDVPVIVEKCINFVYTHGSMTEGIYRRSGSGSSVSELLSKFAKDAFAVQLTSDQFTEHDVAMAIKRFFRDLPEPLLGSNQRQYLYEVSKHNDKDERIRMYRAALEQLPQVSYNTARKLLGHLHFISSQSSKNLMTIDNLCSIWGPTLMHFEDRDGMSNSSRNHQRDTEVVGHLIKFYRYIFPEDPGELEREKHMLRVLEKYSQSPQGQPTKKSAGDLRIWIYLHNKEGKSFNVSVGPNKTAYEVCMELNQHINLPIHELVLEEIVLNDKLIRPIHHEEKVLDVVLKWGYWDEQDRKNNYLTLAALSKYWEFILEKPIPISGEMRFADSKSRLFKLLTFQFTQGKLTCFKDKTGEITLHSWNIEDIIWYFGHESKRNPQFRWTITFIETKSHPTRNKSCPYFGYVIVWSDATQRANWLSAMLKSRYPNNLAPPPNLLPI
ncbi:rhoGAP_ARAP and RA_ARAPs domain-containing protein RhoGAP15B [Leptinotarsa decemlineata]|uniref:rhoGAP_ARAP and RA_ARAPs domain-containing protein RhoGAP15B n=1 Tax=Leptinotarsa decemlineata TaxID=7539 RepID=UPI003D304D8F